MVITTTAEVLGFRAARSFGLVRGNTIRARHIGQDFMATLRNMMGGEVHEYTKLMAEARELMRGASEILCYGTAVTLEPDPSVIDTQAR